MLTTSDRSRSNRGGQAHQTGQRNRANLVFLDAVKKTGMVTVRDLCARANVHRETLMKHVAAGNLPAQYETICGRKIILFRPEEADRYAAQARALLGSRIDMVREAANRQLVTAKQLCKLAGVSRPTLIKHIARGFVRGERKKVVGRRVLVFKKDEARRYAKVARELVATATHENMYRGSPRPPANFVSLRDLAKRSNRNVFFLYDCVKNGELVATIRDTALIVSETEAEKFVARFALTAPPGGLASIPAAAAAANLDQATIRHAIRYGYVAAIPATNIGTSSGVRQGRPQTLVSLEDVRAYAASDRTSRRRKSRLAELVRVGHQLSRRSDD